MASAMVAIAVIEAIARGLPALSDLMKNLNSNMSLAIGGGSGFKLSVGTQGANVKDSNTHEQYFELRKSVSDLNDRVTEALTGDVDEATSLELQNEFVQLKSRVSNFVAANPEFKDMEVLCDKIEMNVMSVLDSSSQLGVGSEVIKGESEDAAVEITSFFG